MPVTAQNAANNAPVRPRRPATGVPEPPVRHRNGVADDGGNLRGGIVHGRGPLERGRGDRPRADLRGDARPFRDPVGTDGVPAVAGRTRTGGPTIVCRFRWGASSAGWKGRCFLTRRRRCFCSGRYCCSSLRFARYAAASPGCSARAGGGNRGMNAPDCIPNTRREGLRWPERRLTSHGGNV